MKANGKKMKMFMYESHDYMDMYPEKHLVTYRTQEEVDSFITYMREHWNSGTITNAKELTPIELFRQRQSRYWKGCEELIDNAALDCTQAWVDEYYFYVTYKDYDEATLLRMYDDYVEDMISNYIDNEF